MLRGNSNWYGQRHYLSGIDRHTVSGLLSDTLMSGAINNVLVRVVVPMPRLLTLGRIVAATLLFAFCGNLLYAGQAKPKPKKHDSRHVIDQLEESWRNAMLKSDTAALSALLADDFLAITSSGTLHTKQETLANLQNRRLRLTALNVSDRKVRFYGNTALVTSLAEVEGANADGDVSGSFRYTRVYVRDAQGNWKIVSFEASRIREPGARRSQNKDMTSK
jgi:ketosteroid isomerase-like protein